MAAHGDDHNRTWEKEEKCTRHHKLRHFHLTRIQWAGLALLQTCDTVFVFDGFLGRSFYSIRSSPSNSTGQSTFHRFSSCSWIARLDQSRRYAAKEGVVTVLVSILVTHICPAKHHRSYSKQTSDWPLVLSPSYLRSEVMKYYLVILAYSVLNLHKIYQQNVCHLLNFENRPKGCIGRRTCTNIYFEHGNSQPSCMHKRICPLLTTSLTKSHRDIKLGQHSSRPERRPCSPTWWWAQSLNSFIPLYITCRICERSIQFQDFTPPSRRKSTYTTQIQGNSLCREE